MITRNPTKSPRKTAPKLVEIPSLVETFFFFHHFLVDPEMASNISSDRKGVDHNPYDWCTLYLRIITPVATKLHVILQSFVVFTWMRDTIELV